MANENERYPNVAPGRALVTIKEAQRILSYGKTKTYEVINRGDIESVKEGHMSRVVVDSINEYLWRLRGSPR